VRAADQVITTSPGYARALAARYRIPEPPLVRNIPERVAAEAAVAADAEPVIVYVGGLMRGRGLEQMIDALVWLPSVRLRAIGPGAAGYRAALVARAVERGVGDRFELVDAVPPDEVQAMLADAAIGLCLIQPVCRSYELSLPNKLFEYVAAGLPVLASDLEVIAAVVREHGLGEVVPAANPSAIAAGVRRLLDPAVHATAVAAAQRFAAATTWRCEADVLAAVYAALLR
jgi:glycosyltransferase involved in cell wall biosynthesis